MLLASLQKEGKHWQQHPAKWETVVVNHTMSMQARQGPAADKEAPSQAQEASSARALEEICTQSSSKSR